MDPTLCSERVADALLIERSQGAPEAFREVFDRHVDAIHRFLCARVGSDDAEDLTAETFVVALSKRAAYLPLAATARPWLLGIALRLAQDHQRAGHRQARAYRRASHQELEGGIDADARIDATGLTTRLREALAALRPEDRNVVLLFALGELDYDAIATTLGIRPGTVRSRLHRARAQLAAQFPDWKAT